MGTLIDIIDPSHFEFGVSVLLASGVKILDTDIIE